MVRLLAQNATGLSQSLVFALLVLVDVFVAILAWYIVSNRAGCLLTPKGPSLPEGTVSPPSCSLVRNRCADDAKEGGLDGAGEFIVGLTTVAVASWWRAQRLLREAKR
jgi:hypothetical protein